MPLVILPPMVLKIGGRDLTHRVHRDEGCIPTPSSIARDAIGVLLRYITVICSPRSTPPVRKLSESGSCGRAASMAWTGETPGALCSTILHDTPGVDGPSRGGSLCMIPVARALRDNLDVEACRRPLPRSRGTWLVGPPCPGWSVVYP